jgi:hypothetical protein
MTRDDLVEAMAMEIHQKGDDYKYKTDAKHCDLCRWTAQDMAPAVVEFVAAWLETVPLRYEPEPRAWELARKWREEVGV